MERLPATRMALLAGRATRRVAERGAELLRAKREALAVELLAAVRGVVAERVRLDERLREAVKALALARALDGEVVLESLALAGARQVPVEVDTRRVWGIPVPTVRAPRLVRSPDARGASPWELTLAAGQAALLHEEVLELMLGICSDEARLKRVGEAIHNTSRRINALEHLVLPALARELARVENALDERAREDFARLKRFKAGRAGTRDAGVHQHERFKQFR
ncbi:MAG: V-type ATP synthase subunit D [Myxococcota bacterium]